MSALTLRVFPPGMLGPLLGPLRTQRARRMVERNFLVARRTPWVIVTGFFEPVFYLWSIGVGIGKMVGAVPGSAVGYTTYVAPALLAASAMNGAVYDSTMNVFHKLRYAKTYDAILTTPMTVGDLAVGEIGWALLRGQLYATAFLLVMAAMGLIVSPWALLALPAATLIGFGFAAVGMAATSFMRSWTDFDYVQLAVLPLFLFSGTFYPVSSYPGWVQAVMECTPLYHGVAMMRSLTLGTVGWPLLGHAAYLAAMGVAGAAVAARRLRTLLLR